MQTYSKGHTYTTCIALIGAHKRGKAVVLMNGENPRLNNTFTTTEVSAKQSIKRQLHTTHVGAFGWEPHRSSSRVNSKLKQGAHRHQPTV